jgi:hypothetical protein
VWRKCQQIEERDEFLAFGNREPYGDAGARADPLVGDNADPFVGRDNSRYILAQVTTRGWMIPPGSPPGCWPSWADPRASLDQAGWKFRGGVLTCLLAALIAEPLSAQNDQL